MFRFCLLFEKRIEGFLESEGYSISEFWQRLTKAVDDDAPLDGMGFVLEALKAATDFQQFSITMRQMRRDQGPPE